MSVFEDGQGQGYLAGVNKNNQMLSLSASEALLTYIAKENQDSYLIATNFVSLTTTASFNGMLYIKNTSTTKRFHVHHFRVCSDGSGSLKIKVIKNPTAGTLISDASAATANNTLFASSATFPGLAYVASGDGKTITDGSHYTQFINRSPGHSVQYYDGSLILESGNALAVVVQPSVATDCCVEFIGYFEEI